MSPGSTNYRESGLVPCPITDIALRPPSVSVGWEPHIRLLPGSGLTGEQDTFTCYRTPLFTGRLSAHPH